MTTYPQYTLKSQDVYTFTINTLDTLPLHMPGAIESRDLMRVQPFPPVISEPYETHGSGACTQHFAHPVPSLEATFAISNTRMSCGKRTSSVLEAHWPHTAGQPSRRAMAWSHQGYYWRLGGIKAKDGGGLLQTV